MDSIPKKFEKRNREMEEQEKELSYAWKQKEKQGTVKDGIKGEGHGILGAKKVSPGQRRKAEMESREI